MPDFNQRKDTSSLTKLDPGLFQANLSLNLALRVASGYDFSRNRSKQPLVVLQVLWKAYIDFEINAEEYDRTRDLYERLLNRTQHVKVRKTRKRSSQDAGHEI